MQHLILVEHLQLVVVRHLLPQTLQQYQQYQLLDQLVTQVQLQVQPQLN